MTNPDHPAVDRRTLIGLFLGILAESRGQEGVLLPRPTGRWIACPYTGPDGRVLGRFRAFCTSFEIDIGVPGQPLRLSLVPGGAGMRGSETPWSPWIATKSTPVMAVQLEPFLLASVLFTSGQWLAAERLPRVASEISRQPFAFPFTREGEDRWPVEDVRGTDAGEVASRLRQLTGLAFRLPSETEWEYACRAGTVSKYHFGESYGPSYPESEVLGQRFTPVGSIDAPNRYGLFDMHGPLGSWCSDWAFPDYSFTPVNGAPLTRAPGVEEYRIIRGLSLAMGSAGRFHFPERGSLTFGALRLALSFETQGESRRWADPTVERAWHGETGLANEISPGGSLVLEGEFPALDWAVSDEEVEVYLGEVRAPVLRWRAREIVAAVPADLPPGAPVSVVVRAGFQSTAPVFLAVVP